jgi:hypothetical protein
VHTQERSVLVIVLAVKVVMTRITAYKLEHPPALVRHDTIHGVRAAVPLGTGAVLVALLLSLDAALTATTVMATIARDLKLAIIL